MKKFNPEGKDSLVVEDPQSAHGEEFIVRLDGPFGTAADDVWRFEVVYMIATGIGVTPYASLLKSIQHRLEHQKKMNIKKVFFAWLNREEGSWGWFADELLSTCSF